MQLDPNKTVREVAVEIPGATRVLEQFQIDYCCGGSQQLGEACARAGIDLEVIKNWLQAAENAASTTASLPPQTESLAELAAYIVDKHHIYTRDALQRISLLVVKVVSAHGTKHPELAEIQSEFQTLCTDLGPHMLKEENILFPYIARLESAAMTNGPAPFAPFGTVQSPIAVMMQEHDAAGDILKKIRRLSRNFSVPADACISYRTLYEAFQEFEADLHQHIHLENNILFPKAVALEVND